MSRLKRIRNWYGRFERPISSLSLIGGFVFDALTLKRVDLFWENFWVVAHIVIVGICILLIHAIERREGDEANPSRLHFWLVNIQQFFYGGIWSVFLVFYFRSSDIAASWPFMLILALSFIANERLKRSFVRLTFQVTLFFLSIFCFAIFLVPVVVHKIGAEVFLFSGALSLACILLFLALIRLSSRRKLPGNKWLLYGSIVGVYVLVNVLYFAKLIPPIPLSVKDAGVYYSVSRNRGGYLVSGEEGSRGIPQKIRQWFTLYPAFHRAANQPVFVYTAVFSPPQFSTTIVHEWQRKDGKGDWVTVSRIPLSVVGGREGGFRTYSEKFNPAPGMWRVNVTTQDGQVIGSVRFKIILTNMPSNPVESLK